MTYDFPKVFGVEPILGRTFTPDEDKPNGPPVVVLSAALWRERFGGDRNVIGRTIRLNGRTRTIIGVMPAGGVVSRRCASCGCRWPAIRRSRTRATRATASAG